MIKEVEEMNNYTVYMHISPSDKRYIGLTSLKPEYRWNDGKGYKYNQYFINAINKYGWDNFQHIIIAKGLSEDEAKWLEIELIKVWDSSNRKYGYNVSLGGESGNHSEETKKILSETHKGKVHSEETKNKISENHADFSGKNNPTAKSVICLTTKRIFYTAKEGAEYYNCCYSGVSVCCKGRQKYCGKLSNGTKLVWRYIEIIEL